MPGLQRHSHTFFIIAIINFLTLLLSIPILVLAIWLALRSHHDCFPGFLHAPIAFLGAAIFFFSLIGFLAAKYHSLRTLAASMVLLFLIALLFLAFTLFIFFVTRGGGGHRVQGAAFKEYRLHDFSQWLTSRVTNEKKWQGFKRCLQEKEVCGILNEQYRTLGDFDNAHLSSIQSGCCKPPTACGDKFVTATHWEKAGSSDYPDCGKWNNNPYELCFECDSCRAGLLEMVNEDWVKVVKACGVLLIMLAFLYLMEFSACVKLIVDV